MGRMNKVLVSVLLVLSLLVIPSVGVSSAYNLTSCVSINQNVLTVNIFGNECPVTIDPSTPGYSADSTTMTIEGTDYDGVALSNDSNSSGGIADSRGNVDVTLDLSDSRPFCFAIYGGGGKSRLDFDLTVNGVTTSYRASLTNNNGWLYVGSDGSYESIGALDGADVWFTTPGTVSVDIGSVGRVSQAVMLTILFKP